MPIVYGHYFLQTTPSVFPGFACQPVTLPTPPEQYLYAAEPSNQAPSGVVAGHNQAAPAEWAMSPVYNYRKGTQAPFDMDTLKAAIQAAKPDCGEVRRAIESSTFKPRERAFTRLINMCGRQKESRKALEVFATMCDYRGVRPNTYTYSALISACSSAGDWDLAVDVYRRMKAAAASDPRCLPNQVRR